MSRHEYADVYASMKVDTSYGGMERVKRYAVHELLSKHNKAQPEEPNTIGLLMSALGVVGRALST
jgi:hypothetical protein